MRRLTVASAATVMAMVVALVSPAVVLSEPGQGGGARIINLVQTEQCHPYICVGRPGGQPTSGRLNLHMAEQIPWGDGSDMLFSADGLGYPAGQAYALYLYEGPPGDGTLLGRWLFNLDPYSDGTGNFGYGPVDGVDAPALTAYVVYEVDDGHWFEPSEMNEVWVALIGTSTLD